MEQLGSTLSNKTYILRSGNAEGADQAFERGVINSSYPVLMDVYVPWESFITPLAKPVCYKVVKEFPNFKEALEIARSVHPAWDRCSNGAKMLHARNAYQILGHNLNQPSIAVFYYAEPLSNGMVKGGTNTAVQIAKRWNIPTFNLYFPFVQSVVHQYIAASNKDR